MSREGEKFGTKNNRLYTIYSPIFVVICHYTLISNIADILYIWLLDLKPHYLRTKLKFSTALGLPLALTIL